MKKKQTARLLAAFALGGALFATACPAHADEWALLIGIDQYEDTNHITSLGGASADARALAMTLHSAAGFPEDHVKVLVSDGQVKPTRVNILNELTRLSRNAKAGDTVFVLYSGHGIDIDGTPYLLPYDTSALSEADITDSALETAKFRARLQQVKAGALILAFDMCRSDPRKSGKAVTAPDNKLSHALAKGLDLTAAAASGAPAAPDAASSPIAVTLYSCAEGERSYEWQDKGRGYFSYYLEQGLKGAAANASGQITVGGLASYVGKSVKTSVENEEHHEQTPYPNLDGPGAAEFVLARTGARAPMTVATLGVVPAVVNAAKRPVLPLHVLLTTLTGHSGTVSAASFSADGRYIVTGSYDQTAKIWDAVTGRELRTLEGHNGAVTSASFSADGRFVVTGSADKSARVWDAATGRLICTLAGHTGGVTAASFSPDGRYVVTANFDKTAKIWDAATGQVLRTLSGHTDTVTAASFSPDSHYIVTGSDDNTARVWDAETGQELRTLSGHGDHVYAASFSPDAQYIVTASEDMTAKVWNAATGQEIRTFKGHTSPVLAASFSDDGRYLVTGSNDNTAKVWDVVTGHELRTLRGHTDPVHAVSFSPDSRFIVTGSNDKTAKVWDAATGRTGNVSSSPKR